MVDNNEHIKDNKNANKEFGYILDKRQEIINGFDLMCANITTLKNIYLQIIKNHVGDDFNFGIDALYFQNEIIEKDYIHLRENLNSIERRMYCEYYTLYMQIQRYVNEEIESKHLSQHSAFNRVFPIYKHIGTSSNYDMKIVIQIHSVIVECMLELETNVNVREHILVKDKQHSNMGLNIHTIVYREEFTLALMRARIKMYYDYLHSFFEHHSKYLNRLLMKAKLQMDIVSEDIMLKNFMQSSKIVDNINSITGHGENICEKNQEAVETQEAVFHIAIGSRVLVDGYDSIGTLRYYGLHKNQNGKRCGIEFDKACGKNDGTIGGHRYFTCKPLHGVLVAPYKITLANSEKMV